MSNRTLTSFGGEWIERIPLKLSDAEREALMDHRTDDETRARIRGELESRSVRRPTDEDATAAALALSKHHEGPFSCANVVLPTGHGLVVHERGFTRF